MADAENKVHYGLSDVAIAVMEPDGSYGKPVKVPGAVGLTTTPEGTSNTFWADNGAYLVTSTNAGYTGDLEMALIPDEIKAQILPYEIDANGALVEVADRQAKSFALLFAVDGDAKQRRNVFYRCKADRPSGDDKTTEGDSAPTTEKLPITMSPTVIAGRRVTKLSLEDNALGHAAYAGFYGAVLMPKSLEGADDAESPGAPGGEPAQD